MVHLVVLTRTRTHTLTHTHAHLHTHTHTYTCTRTPKYAHTRACTHLVMHRSAYKFTLADNRIFECRISPLLPCIDADNLTTAMLRAIPPCFETLPCSGTARMLFPLLLKADTGLPPRYALAHVTPGSIRCETIRAWACVRVGPYMNDVCGVAVCVVLPALEMVRNLCSVYSPEPHPSAAAGAERKARERIRQMFWYVKPCPPYLCTFLMVEPGTPGVASSPRWKRLEH